MSNTLATAILYGGIGLLILIMLFWLFEKPLYRLYVRCSNKRFYKKTGIKIG